MGLKLIFLITLVITMILFVFKRRKPLPHFKRTGSKPADVVILNGRIFTSDSSNPWAEAIAIKDRYFVYVGDAGEIDDYIGMDTEIINADGKMITPGFIDNHCHVAWIGGLQAVMNPLMECRGFEDIKKSMQEFSAKYPDDPFVMGVGWNYDHFENRFPNMEMGDEIISDKPMFLMSNDGETGWLNTLAYEKMKSRPDQMRKFDEHLDEKTGKPSGIIFKFHGINPLEFYDEKELPDDFRERIFQSIDKTLSEALKCGITTVNDSQIYKNFIDYLLEYQKQGRLSDIRLRGSYYIDHLSHENLDRLKEELDEWKELEEDNFHSHLILGDSVKLYIEGLAISHSSLMLEPYCDEPDNYGEALWTQEQFNRVIDEVDRQRIQACTHACGDGGTRMVINAYEHAREVNGAWDSRHRIDHCEFVAPEDQIRMAQLGIHAAMQPCHFFGSESYERIFGEERLKRIVPWKSFEESGMTISFGSDWCAGPMNPIYGILMASLRLNYKLQDNWGSEQKIPIENILRHYTIDSAKGLKMDDRIGSIEEGKFADLAIFDIDLFSLNSTWFLMTHKLEIGAMDDFVDMTFVDGRIVYSKQSPA